MKHAKLIHRFCLNNWGNRKTFIKAPSHFPKAVVLIGKQAHLLRLLKDCYSKEKDVVHMQHLYSRNMHLCYLTINLWFGFITVLSYITGLIQQSKQPWKLLPDCRPHTGVLSCAVIQLRPSICTSLHQTAHFTNIFICRSSTSHHSISEYIWYCTQTFHEDRWIFCDH